jgi:hypothetical protein
LVLADVHPEANEGGGPGGPLFLKRVGRVRQAMAVASRCRRPAVLDRWRALGPRIAPWERAHSRAIAAPRRRWEALVSEAELEPPEPPRSLA